MANLLEGKVCLVTGAAGGLGKAIAQAFLAAGARVILCDINEERLKDTAEELSALHPDKTIALQTDITKESAVERLFKESLDKCHRLDVLVNNAGLMDRFDPVGSTEKQEWDRVLAVNLTAPYLMSKAAVNQMLAQDLAGGTIINIASAASLAGFRAGAAYTASKHGLIGLTKNTAAFYGKKGVRCVAVLPGGMQTHIGDHFANGMNQEGYNTMLGTAGMQPPMCSLGDVAKTAIFLCSDAAAVCNGACIPADHGWLAY